MTPEQKAALEKLLYQIETKAFERGLLYHMPEDDPFKVLAMSRHEDFHTTFPDRVAEILNPKAKSIPEEKSSPHKHHCHSGFCSTTYRMGSCECDCSECMGARKKYQQEIMKPKEGEG